MKSEEFREFVKDHMIDDDVNYLGNALSGEVGEVNNILKRMYIKTKSEQYKQILEANINSGVWPTLEEQLQDELGDVLFYLFAILSKFDLSLSDILDLQKHKVIGQSITYQEKFKK